MIHIEEHDDENARNFKIDVESPKELYELVSHLIPLTESHNGKLLNGTALPASVAGAFQGPDGKGYRVIVSINHA